MSSECFKMSQTIPFVVCLNEAELVAYTGNVDLLKKQNMNDHIGGVLDKFKNVKYQVFKEDFIFPLNRTLKLLLKKLQKFVYN